MRRLQSAALAISAVGAAAVVADAASIGLPCPLLTVTGVPCPACGMTRVAAAISRGEVGLAFTVDPAGSALVAMLAALAALAVLTWTNRRPTLPWLRAPHITIAILLALTVHWATTLGGGGFVNA